MRLVGYINGIEVKFDFFPPNRFIGNIPSQLNNQYIVELHAIDDAGNESLYTNMIVLIDVQHMIFKIINSEFTIDVNENNYGSGKYGYNEMIPTMNMNLVQEYTYREWVM